MGGHAKARGAAAALGVLGLLCAVLGAVMIVMLPSLIKQQVLKNVRVHPSSLSFNMWKEIPVPFYLSVYFFNVLNPDEVLKGKKPQVQELGPYVYREFRHKTNITFHDNDTVSFLEYRSYQFQPAKSRGSESDYVVIPNILVMSASMMMEDRPMSLKLMMTLAFTTLGQRAFMNRTVSEIMWGYDDPLMNLINKYFPGMFPFNGKFGLFAELNNSDSGLFTVFTGVKNFSRIHLVDKWNGLSKVNFWHSDQCNMINGTAGQMWAPFMTPESSLEFYSPDACRSMKLIYKESGVFEGIPTYRFVAPKTLFANGSDYPPNEGFCPCMESGIQNVSTCRQTGSIEPVVLPLLWFGESGAMEGETLRTFYTQLVLLPKVLHYAQYVLLGLGCVLLLIPVVYQVRSQGPKDGGSRPSLAAGPEQPPSPHTPLLQDSLHGQPASPQA
ncbi:scavenger receptor class B member 1 isoform X9 [Eulemur rufifrons]|uniref:scavenger receptor class B member 1 isoform X9 n=1 Tax=Eulemur rufifrons TaxID=859984 RepID=UPI0037422333